MIQQHYSEPDEDQLKAALLTYAQERLLLEAHIARLGEEFQYCIRSLTKLKALQKKSNIPVVRKPPTRAEVTTLVCEKMAQDPQRRNGPTTIMQMLSLDGYAIPQSMVQEDMHANDPQVNCDGHEKFASLALGMGPVGIPVYGIRDKWSGTILHLVVVPNARKAVVIGHLYLDFIEKYGGMSQWTKEVKLGICMHTALRQNYTPDLNPNEWPVLVALTSTHNIPIENLWSQLHKFTGFNIQAAPLEGKTNGLLNPNNGIHV
ncbi:hypothetical protein EW026_g7292 [Hermanssonia centrifuga]|uniref:Uncharacterized protein n=1 Tax=Hermanssonia centrifuga TaxID=98765 RepID=A0A4S4K8E4_9APHY|nr:hypothetical protein EW026_g7292 [Hermanssonia centrifuga]